MNRWLVAVVAALCTTGTFRLYSQVVLPLTQLRSAPIPPPMVGETDFQPLIFAKTAEEFFPDAPWTLTAKVKWQRPDESAFLFAETVEREKAGHGNAVKMTRVAILWKDPQRPGAPPFRLIANSAHIQFENPFLGQAIDLTSAKPGRIVNASLDGAVLIDGPDGLRILGRDFVFSEQAAQLYSDHPVQFAYGPSANDELAVEGQAGRIVLDLTPTTQPVLGEDMPLIAGISTLQLRSNVELRLTFESEGRPAAAKLTCRGAFDYDFETKTAVFSEDVLVQRFSEAGPSASVGDELSCDQLQLQFEETKPPDDARPLFAGPREQSSPANGGWLDGLKLRSAHASGKAEFNGQPAVPVVVRSTGTNVTARCSELQFDQQQSTATLADPHGVKVLQGSTLFESPWIRLRQTETGKLAELDCRGTGKLTHRDPRWGHEPLEATWQGGIVVKPEDVSGLQTIDITDQVQLLIPGQLGLMANRLKLWVDPEVIEGIQGRQNVLAGPLPIRRIDAVDHVEMVSADLHVRKADSIVAFVHPGQIAPSADRHSSMPASNSSAVRRSSETSDRWEVETDHLQVDVVHDPKSAMLDLKQIRGHGRTKVTRASSPSTDVAGFQVQGNLVLSGFGLLLTSEGENRQTLTVDAGFNDNGDLKQWAELSQGDVKIEGARLHFDRAQNLAGVDGQGRLQLPLTRDMSGRELDSPSTLTVVWTERMEFDGRAATFFGRVRTSMASARDSISVFCEYLNVSLDRRISFTDEHPDTKGLKIEEIHCKHHVRLDAYQWTGRPLTAKREIELAEFIVNQTSGELFGRGPGTMEFWTLGDAVRLSPNAPKANQPAESGRPQWRYTKVHFAGQIKGNIHQQFAELQDRVELLSAPVPEASHRFQVVQLADSTPQAENAAFLKCDRLRVTQRTKPNGKESYNELLAYDSVELEGHSFRATANELAYDEQSGKFVLRGHGQNARLHFMDAKGVWQAPTEGLFVTFDPVKRTFTADGLTGASGRF